MSGQSQRYGGHRIGCEGGVGPANGRVADREPFAYPLNCQIGC